MAACGLAARLDGADASVSERNVERKRAPAAVAATVMAIRIPYRGTIRFPSLSHEAVLARVIIGCTSDLKVAVILLQW